MALTNCYLTLAEMKTYLGNISDSVDDAALERVISAACRQIDGHCGRFFYQQTSTVKYYTPRDPWLLLVHDLLSVSALASDEDRDNVWEVAWSASDYVLGPRNAPYSVPARPYTQIQTAPAGRYVFIRGKDAVKITGTWGWTAIPDAVIEASFLQASRLFGRKQNPYGTVGSPAFGQVTMLKESMDPDAVKLLEPYVQAVVIP